MLELQCDGWRRLHGGKHWDDNTVSPMLWKTCTFNRHTQKTGHVKSHNHQSFVKSARNCSSTNERISRQTGSEEQLSPRRSRLFAWTCLFEASNHGWDPLVFILPRKNTNVNIVKFEFILRHKPWGLLSFALSHLPLCTESQSLSWGIVIRCIVQMWNEARKRGKDEAP